MEIAELLKREARVLADFSSDDLARLVKGARAVSFEANEAIGKKDFLMKIKTCRREAKESRYWLDLLEVEGALEREESQSWQSRPRN